MPLVECVTSNLSFSGELLQGNAYGRFLEQTYVVFVKTNYRLLEFRSLMAGVKKSAVLKKVQNDANVNNNQLIITYAEALYVNYIFQHQ